MPQYLAKIENNFFTLTNDEQHHIKVARVKIGEQLNIFDGFGNQWLGVLESKEGGKLLKPLPLKVPPKNITLYFSAIARQGAEELITLCTQAGVSAFCPVFSKYSDADLLKKWNTKKERWEQLVLASCKQCQTAKLPKILAPIKFNDALKQLKTPAVICYEDEDTLPLNSVKDLGNDIALFIGPEGGYDKEEIILAKSYGVKVITLGKNILRAQTAAVCAVWGLQNL